MTKKEKTDAFELKLGRLEEIVGLLENETTNLESSIKLFEEGMEISKDLSSRLKEVKLKVEMLKKEASGQLAAVPFDEGTGASDDK